MFVAGSAAADSRSGKRVPARIFKSRAQLKKALGKGVADRIPASFDFELFALGWVELPVSPDANVKIITLPPYNHHGSEYGLRVRHSAALQVQVTRRGGTLEFELMGDAPCSGGMAKPPDAVARCHKRIAASAEEGRKTLHLFATPRYRLKTAKATRRALPKRP